MEYEKVLGEHKFPTYEELKTGLIRLIDEGKISREDAARLLPELRESEDERGRKRAIAILKQQRDYWSYDGPINKFPLATPRKDLVDAIDVALSYLEKQKENPKSADFIPADCVSSAKCEDRNSKDGVFPEDVIVVARACEKLEMHGYPELAHALKNVNLYTKPVDYDHEMWKNCEANFEGGKKEVIDHPEKYGLQKEQKPIEKQDYSGLNDLERAIHRGFLSAGVENVPVTIIKETAKECFTQINPIVAVDAEQLLKILPQKPADWSEEDEEMLECVIMDVESAKKNYLKSTTQVVRQGAILADKELAWLKSLRPQPKRDCKDCAMFLNGKCTKPHWKPNEEQMNCLCAAVDAAIRKHNESVSGYKPARVLKSLYEQLKKL